ncbi:uncharacterized protein LOC144472982 isoform X2 [Augochlora pura]
MDGTYKRRNKMSRNVETANSMVTVPDKDNTAALEEDKIAEPEENKVAEPEKETIPPAPQRNFMHYFNRFSKP